MQVDRRPELRAVATLEHVDQRDEDVVDAVRRVGLGRCEVRVRRIHVEALHASPWSAHHDAAHQRQDSAKGSRALRLADDRRGGGHRGVTELSPCWVRCGQAHVPPVPLPVTDLAEHVLLLDGIAPNRVHLNQALR